MANEKNGSGVKPKLREGFVEFQSDSFTNVTGYWQIPKDGSDKEFIGEELEGILLAEVKTLGGKPADYPFYVFELTAPHKRIFSKEEKKDKAMPAGTLIGVSCWTNLNGLGRKLGHQIVLTYTGQRKLEKGKTLKEFHRQCSAKPIREIEPQHEDVVNKGDKEQEVPF
jgi:hypothetical protein